MREIDTDVLRFVGRSLGVSNPVTATALQQFDDDVLQQVLSVESLVRRGRTARPESDAGIYMMEFSVSVNGTASTAIDPYATDPDSTLAFNGWPGVQATEEVWLFGAQLRDRGGGGFTDAHLEMDISDLAGITRQAAGPGPFFDTSYFLAGWLGSATPINNVYPDPQGRLVVPINMRLPRNPGSGDAGNLVFVLQTGVLNEVVCHVFFGVYSAGLGQDGAF